MIWRNNFPTSALKLLKNQPISNHHSVKISDWKVRSIFTNNVNKVDNTDFSKIKRKITSISSDHSKFLKDLKVPDLKAELKKTWILPKNLEETQKKSKSVTGNQNTVWKL